MRRHFARFRFVVALLVAMLACGRGLPGLVRAAVASSAHVCTCATGGSHAACPVCNGSIEARRGVQPAVEGVPCGEQRDGVEGVALSAVFPAPFAKPACPVTPLAPCLTRLAAVPEASREPETPPPRTCRT